MMRSEVVAGGTVARAQLQCDGFFLFPATPSGRALANRVREVAAAAKAADFEHVASGSRWQGRAGCRTALAPVARVVQHLVTPLPFLAPPWAKGQQPHHNFDEQLAPCRGAPRPVRRKGALRATFGYVISRKGPKAANAVAHADFGLRASAGSSRRPTRSLIPTTLSGTSSLGWVSELK